MADADAKSSDLPNETINASMGESLKNQMQELIDKAGGIEVSESHESEFQLVKKHLNAAFDKIPVSLFPGLPSGKVIEIPSDATIAQVVSTLSRHNILSAPVRNVVISDEANWPERYLGMVDFAGIVLWVLKEADVMAAAITAGAAGAGGIAIGLAGTVSAAVLGVASLGVLAGVAAGAAAAAMVAGAVAKTTAGRSGTAAAEALGEDFFKLLHDSELYQKTKVSEIAGTFRWGPFLPVQPNDSLLALLLLQSKYRLKRVPLVDPSTGNITNLITQSAVVRILDQCSGSAWYDALASQSLEDIGLPVMAKEDVISVDAYSPVLEAFQVMQEYEVGGLPVVEGEEKRIIGNISARDIRFLLAAPQLFNADREPTVIDLMEKAETIHIHEVDATLRPAMTPPIRCKPNVTLKSVISTFASSGIHRIYVVDEIDSVVGVVTLRDIISRFVEDTDGLHGNFFMGMTPSVATINMICTYTNLSTLDYEFINKVTGNKKKKLNLIPEFRKVFQLHIDYISKKRKM